MNDKKTKRNRRIRDMRRMRQKCSLQSIADKYGISRERVRQLIGNTGRIKIENRKKRTTK